MLNQTNQESFKRQLREIERENEAFAREKAKLFDSLNLTPDEVHRALKNRSQYSERDWEKLELLKKEMEDQLRRDLDNIRNPEKTKKAYESRNLPPWALFCR